MERSPVCGPDCRVHFAGPVFACVRCATRPGHSDRVTCIAISADGTTLASGQITHMGYLAEIILWDISLIGSEGHPKLLYRLRLHKVQVQALDFSHSGKYLASIGGSDDNNLVIWNVATGKAVRRFLASQRESTTLSRPIVGDECATSPPPLRLAGF